MTRPPTHIKIMKYSSSTVKHNDDYHIRRHITEDRSLGTVGLIASMKHHRQKDHPSSTSPGLIFLFIFSAADNIWADDKETLIEIYVPGSFFIYLSWITAYYFVILCVSSRLQRVVGHWYLTVDKYSSLAQCVLCGGWLIMTQRATLSSWQLINQTVSTLNTENSKEMRLY